MKTKFIEVSHGPTAHNGGNWGKFMLGAFEHEWQLGSSVAPEYGSLLRARGWTSDHILFLDLETGEGTMLLPSGSVHADLEKHKVWVCPMAEPFLEWLYQQDLSDLDALPAYVELPDAPFAMAGYRRPGKA